MTNVIIKAIRNNFILITAFLFGLSLNNKTSLFCVLLFILSIFQLKKAQNFHIQISKYGICLFTTMATYTLINFFYDDDMSQLFITYLLLPTAAYMAGSFIINKEEKGQMFHNKVIYSAAIGFFAYGMLNIYQRYEKGYHDLWWIGAGRMSSDYWTGIDLWPTIEATYFLPISALLFYSLVIQKNKVLKLLYSAIIVTVAWVAADIGSRTMLVVPISMATVFLIVYLRKKEIIQTRRMALFSKVIVVAVVGIVIYQVDFAGVKTTLEASSLYSRMNGKTYDNVDSLISTNGRELRYAMVLSEMPTHLLGNIDLGGGIAEGGLGSAHNTWLDIYRIAGVIPFSLFVAASIMLFKRIRYLIQRDTMFGKMSMPVIAILIILNIQFMSEAMFALNTQILNFYFLLCGMLDSIYLSMKYNSYRKCSGMEVVS